MSRPLRGQHRDQSLSPSRPLPNESLHQGPSVRRICLIEQRWRWLRQGLPGGAALARRAAPLLDVQPVAPIAMPAVPAAQRVDGLRVARRGGGAGCPFHRLAIWIAEAGLRSRRAPAGADSFRTAWRAGGSGQAHRSHLPVGRKWMQCGPARHYSRLEALRLGRPAPLPDPPPSEAPVPAHHVPSGPAQHGNASLGRIDGGSDRTGPSWAVSAQLATPRFGSHPSRNLSSPPSSNPCYPQGGSHRG